MSRTVKWAGLGSGPINVLARSTVLSFTAPPEKEWIIADLFWLTDKQVERLRPFFPKSRGRALADRGITRCIPYRRGRKFPIPHDPVFYRQRHRIENMFACLKDWRRIATRSDHCAKVFLLARALATLVMFWL